MVAEKKGFEYVFTKEKYDQYKKIPAWQKLVRLEKMNRFLYYFMPQTGKIVREKIRKGEM